MPVHRRQPRTVGPQLEGGVLLVLVTMTMLEGIRGRYTRATDRPHAQSTYLLLVICCLFVLYWSACQVYAPLL